MNDVQWGLSPATPLAAGALPPHCTPTTPFLDSLSAFLHTCIPTPLAFLSTAFGTLSIISWLFAQLPQVIKNFRLRSASGLSIYFLVEWCLGDISNLTGALLTGQATWQIIIGAYYCFVDLMLVGQWVWYEFLHHGRPLRSVWLRKVRSWSSTGKRNADTGSNEESSIVQQQQQMQVPTHGSHASPRAIQNGQFTTPDYDHTRLSPASASFAVSPNTASRSIVRNGQSSSTIPSPSPRTLLMLSTILALASRGLAAPTNTVGISFAEPIAIQTDNTSTSYAIGICISWMSTALYLGSRLPQIIKNARLRSTAGLSPLLFLAAFSGNLFYSLSLAVNPLAWHSYGPYGAHGWAPASGSYQEDFVSGALPFFLGAAGVLVLDASVGVQFWLFREKEDSEVVVVVEDGVDGMKGAVGRGMRRVSGWMRGWAPGLGVATPRGSLRESQGLLSNGEDRAYGT